MYIILIYDIKQDDNYANVQRRVFNICKKYLVHVQKSVFEGELSQAQLIKLSTELKRYLRHEKDSCIVFKSRSKKWLDKEYLTMDLEEDEQFI